jgi:hypothetical protein
MGMAPPTRYPPMAAKMIPADRQPTSAPALAKLKGATFDLLVPVGIR